MSWSIWRLRWWEWFWVGWWRGLRWCILKFGVQCIDFKISNIIFFPFIGLRSGWLAFTSFDATCISSRVARRATRCFRASSACQADTIWGFTLKTTGWRKRPDMTDQWLLLNFLEMLYNVVRPPLVVVLEISSYSYCCSSVEECFSKNGFLNVSHFFKSRVTTPYKEFFNIA